MKFKRNCKHIYTTESVYDIYRMPRTKTQYVYIVTNCLYEQCSFMHLCDAIRYLTYACGVKDIRRVS